MSKDEDDQKPILRLVSSKEEDGSKREDLPDIDGDMQKQIEALESTIIQCLPGKMKLSEANSLLYEQYMKQLLQRGFSRPEAMEIITSGGLPKFTDFFN